MARMKLAPALKDLAVPIDDISPWPGNPREGDIGAISESLRRFGQQKPIVVQQSSMNIVAGNHLWAAAKTLGWSEVAANVAKMDDKTARAFLIADNRTSELGSYDDAGLGDLLASLAKEGNLQGTGYDGEDVDRFLRDLERETREKVAPEVAFSSELLESHNYLVLYFDNELDWSAAKEALGIESSQTWDSREGYERKGIGRIVRGAEVISRLA